VDSFALPNPVHDRKNVIWERSRTKLAAGIEGVKDEINRVVGSAGCLLDVVP
jgi:hypothetical protein